MSLTTYPARADSAWQAIRTIQRQRVAADRIILTLWEGDFPERNLPDKLVRLAAEGVEILWSEVNLRSYLKLLPVLRLFPEALIVTADDDTLYPWRWLETLVVGHRSAPDAVIALRAHVMQRQAGGLGLEPYNSWPRATPDTPWQHVFPTGVGGVLYPPDAFSDTVLETRLAVDLCPHADDIWFKAMTLLHGTRSVVAPAAGDDPVVIFGSQGQQLMAVNVNESANDEQLKRTFAHFNLWKSLPEPALPVHERDRSPGPERWNR